MTSTVQFNVNDEAPHAHHTPQLKSGTATLASTHIPHPALRPSNDPFTNSQSTYHDRLTHAPASSKASLPKCSLSRSLRTSDLLKSCCHIVK